MGLSSLRVVKYLSWNESTRNAVFATSRRSLFETKFKPEMEEKILKFLNSCGEVQELMQYSISKSSGTKLLARRKEQGCFKSLDDPMSTLNPKVLEKLYKSIANEGKKSKGIRGTALVPALPQVVVADAVRVVSLSCTLGRISWTAADRSDSSVIVRGLAVKELSVVSKTHFLHVLETVKEIANDIPRANLYVFEEPSMGAPATPFQVPFLLQKMQLRSFVLGLLAARNEKSHFVTVKSLAVARLFNLRVGTERVSGQRVVDSIMANKTNMRVEERIRLKFLNTNVEEREFVSEAFLLNAAYWVFTNQVKLDNI